MKHSFYSLMTAMALLAMSPASSMAQGLKDTYKDVVYAWDVVNEAMTDDPKAATSLSVWP